MSAKKNNNIPKSTIYRANEMLMRCTCENRSGQRIEIRKSREELRAAFRAAAKEVLGKNA